jgi:hypothetical protein
VTRDYPVIHKDRAANTPSRIVVYRATSLAEALTMAERADAGRADSVIVPLDTPDDGERFCPECHDSYNLAAGCVCGRDVPKGGDRG